MANDPSKQTAEENGSSPRFADNFFDFAELFLLTLVAVLLITLFVVRHSIVDGSSMDETLADGDRLIISDLFYTPKRGDIIVFEDYTIGEREQKPLVKRVIGTAGDTILIRCEQKNVNGTQKSVGVVYVNGVALDEPYTYYDTRNDYVEMPEITVPEGQIFVLGDHRTVSLDSRYFGCISEDAVLGKVLFRIFPFKPISSEGAVN